PTPILGIVLKPRLLPAFLLVQLSGDHAGDAVVIPGEPTGPVEEGTYHCAASVGRKKIVGTRPLLAVEVVQTLTRMAEGDAPVFRISGAKPISLHLEFRVALKLGVVRVFECLEDLPL